MFRLISKRIVLMGIFLIMVVAAGIFYADFYHIPEEEQFLTTDYTIDANTENNAFLRFITPDGQEKIEISEGQFADGTKIFESHCSKYSLGRWKEYEMNQGEQTVDKVRSVGGNQFYHLLEVIDPAITSLVYEYQTGQKVPLTIVEVNGRRFTAFYRQPWNKEDYQIYGLNEKGQILWDMTSYHTRVAMQQNSRMDYALGLVLEKHPEFPRTNEIKKTSVPVPEVKPLECSWGQT